MTLTYLEQAILVDLILNGLVSQTRIIISLHSILIKTLIPHLKHLIIIVKGCRQIFLNFQRIFTLDIFDISLQSKINLLLIKVLSRILFLLLLLLQFSFSFDYLDHLLVLVLWNFIVTLLNFLLDCVVHHPEISYVWQAYLQIVLGAHLMVIH